MDTAWLESLLALVEHGSFTRAAEAQHVSQPAFSRRIRSLEQWFGADLVDRTTFPVTLTRVGTDVVAFARESVVGGLPLHLRPVAQSDLTAALAGLVVAGVGVGWLPGLAAAPGETSGAIGHIGDPSWTAPLEIRLYRRRRHQLSSQATAVWESARP